MGALTRAPQSAFCWGDFAGAMDPPQRMTYVDYIPDKIYLRIGILIRWINKPPRTFSNLFLF